MEQTHVLFTPFNYFKWKEEMVIQLRSKCMYKVTMETEVEPNSTIEKSKFFYGIDEVFGIICLGILRELISHVDSLTTHN